jgi:hypothetical protein
MSVLRKLRGLVAGMALAAATLGAVSMVPTPSQAAEVSFGIFVHDRQPPMRREFVPPPPHARYSSWERGHWVWSGHRWMWASGHYQVRRHAPPAYDHHHWNYVR